MTVLDVEPTIYYNAGTRIATAATEWMDTIISHVWQMGDLTEMCGTYDEAVEWARTYDERVTAALQMGTDIAQAAAHYGGLLHEMGYNHALAEQQATIGAEAAPDKPEPPPVVMDSCYPPPPSAGGDGQGLIDAGLEIVQKVGVPIPDGNTDLLGRAADVWSALATAAPMEALVTELVNAAWAFGEVTSPEAAHIDEDLWSLREAARTTIDTYAELSTSAREHRDGLNQLRADMRAELEGLGWELLKELAITIAIGVAASVITLGIGTAIASARAVQLAARVVTPLKRLIDAFKLLRLGRGVKVEQNLASHAKEVKRIKDLKSKSLPTRGAGLTDDEWQALTQGPQTKDGRFMNSMLHRGDATPEQQRQIDNFVNALGKLPTHEGQVVRHTNLTPEELARYVPGQPKTELGIVSASTNPAGVTELTVQNAGVEFQIVSKTGRNFTQYGTPDEVLFPPNTNFFVQNKFPDPKTGRIIIQMAEI